MLIRGPASVLSFPAFRQRFPWIGGDLQTLRSALRGGPGVAPDATATIRMSFPSSDGSDDVLQGALNSPAHPRDKPLIVLIHGLTGSENSTHMIVAAQEFLSRGHAVLRLNQRGAGPSRATCQGHYHAGRSDDLAGVIGQLPEVLTRYGVCLLAVSLGGNMLLKFLAEYPRFSQVKAAVAVCPPISLKAAQLRIMARRNTIYHRHLLNRMKREIQGSELIKERADEFLRRLTTVFDFDDQVVAPGNGFADASDYYRRCSALDLLEAVDTPTLIIHPADDPWVPVDPLLARIQSGSPAPNLSVLVPAHGGHVGSHGRGSDVPWYIACAALFFDRA